MGCAECKLRANHSKTTVSPGRLVDVSSLPQSVSSILEPCAFVLKHSGPAAIPVLPGAMPGAETLLRNGSVEVQSLLRTRGAFLDRIAALRGAGLQSHIALSLMVLRTAGDCTFVARACGLPAGDAQSLDDLLESRLPSLLGHGPLPQTSHQCRQAMGTAATSKIFVPTASGGLGFQSQVLSADAAHCASWHETLPKIVARLNVESVAVLETHSPWVRGAVQRGNALARVALSDHTLNIGDPELVASQKILAHASSSAAADAWVAALAGDCRASASWLSAGGSGSSGWLLPPTLPTWRMTDPQHRYALRYRLGLASFQEGSRCCHRRKDGTLCGVVMDTVGTHARTCAVGGWRIKKHNAVAAALASWAEDHCGCEVHKEITLPSAADDHFESRLDLVIVSPQLAGPAFVDVVICSACSVDALQRGSGIAPGTAARIAEAKKTCKYPNIQAWGFGVEDHGRWGASALALARALAPSEPDERSSAMRTLFQSVSTALQKTAAEAMITAGASAS